MATPSTTLPDDTVRFIDPQAVVSVQMSTGFYQRVQNTLLFLIHGKSKADLDEAKLLIETNACAKNSWQEQYMTVLILCKAFEDQIEKQKLVRVASSEEMPGFSQN